MRKHAMRDSAMCGLSPLPSMQTVRNIVCPCTTQRTMQIFVKKAVGRPVQCSSYAKPVRTQVGGQGTRWGLFHLARFLPERGRRAAHNERFGCWGCVLIV